jgi:hypothetical protein
MYTVYCTATTVLYSTVNRRETNTPIWQVEVWMRRLLEHTPLINDSDDRIDRL